MPLQAVKRGILLISGCLLLLLSGCGLRAPEDLYTVPEQSDAYYNLQEALAEVITGEVSYCAPLSGENRQPIQMRDLDGDGKNEAIVFAKTTGEHPLRIYIFTRQEEKFSLVSELTGDGTSFDSVSYAQIDGSPGEEILVGRRVSDQVLSACSIYSFHEAITLELLNANYSAMLLTDLDGDGRSDLFLLKTDAETGLSTAELFRYSEGAMLRDQELPLSGTGTLKRMIAGNTDSDLPAVFVASQSDSGTLSTDVFVLQEGVFSNIARNVDSANVTVRSYAVYAEDIDGDGLVELPEVRSVPSTPEGTSYQMIQWYNLRGDGSKQSKLLTYHDFDRGFYLELDSAWKDTISMESALSAEYGTAVRFLKAGEELFTLYIFTGNNGASLSASEGRFLLLEKNGVCYAASLGSGCGALTEETLKSKFHEIRTSWNTGEM